MSSAPAFGKPPSAHEKVPVLRPLLPDADALLPYLRRIDANRYYTNFGPLVTELEDLLAAHFGVERTELVLVGNGTIALSAALTASGARPGSRCLMPAWTFVASASAAWAANLVPHFVDVSPATWMLDPDAVRARTDLAGVGSVMVVAPFGAPVDIAAWDRFSADTGIPVIVDGAACFDTTSSVASARPGRSLLMISLHATKVYGVGEGGLIISRDQAMIHRVRQVCNFGIWGAPEGQTLGYNAKLSEYHAAVGLAALDAWPERRRFLAALTERYSDALRAFPQVGLVPDFAGGWVSSYCTVRIDGVAPIIVDRLAYMGVETRRWWGNGVHAQPAYRRFPHDDLSVTESLAASVLALPFYHDLSDAQFARVIDCLAHALNAPV